MPLDAITFETPLLPPSKSKYMRAVEAGMQIDEDLWRVAARIGDIKSDAPDAALPFLIWEHGLEILLPWISDLRLLYNKGPGWQRIRGTPESIDMALSWVDAKPDLIDEDAADDWWDLFQLAYDKAITEPAQLARIIALTRLSKAAHTDIIRMYSPCCDDRALEIDGYGEIGGAGLIGDWSGIWVRSDWPKLAFCRDNALVAEMPRDFACWTGDLRVNTGVFALDDAFTVGRDDVDGLLLVDPLVDLDSADSRNHSGFDLLTDRAPYNDGPWEDGPYGSQSNFQHWIADHGENALGTDQQLVQFTDCGGLLIRDHASAHGLTGAEYSDGPWPDGPYPDERFEGWSGDLHTLIAHTTMTASARMALVEPGYPAGPWPDGPYPSDDNMQIVAAVAIAATAVAAVTGMGASATLLPGTALAASASVDAKSYTSAATILSAAATITSADAEEVSTTLTAASAMAASAAAKPATLVTVSGGMTASAQLTLFGATTVNAVSGVASALKPPLATQLTANSAIAASVSTAPAAPIVASGVMAAAATQRPATALTGAGGVTCTAIATNFSGTTVAATGSVTASATLILVGSTALASSGNVTATATASLKTALTADGQIGFVDTSYPDDPWPDGPYPG
jgi:hypothetical protein